MDPIPEEMGAMRLGWYKLGLKAHFNSSQHDQWAGSVVKGHWLCLITSNLGVCWEH